MSAIYIAGILITACFFVEGWLSYALLTLSVILMLVSSHQYNKLRNQVDTLNDRVNKAETDMHDLHMLCGKLDETRNASVKKR